jgi:8-oxo-dGTP diphosphatase
MPRPVTPLLTVDVVIELVDRPGRPIVLIERRNPPAGHALPGGFVDLGETVEAAARREAREETGLEVTLRLLGVYGPAGRLLGSRSRPARPHRQRGLRRRGAGRTAGGR